MLRKVQIGDPGRVMGRYPHQLSGGMQQRVVIAMALASNPGLLILDEPTTGLDATVEAEVLELVAQLREEFRSSVLFISHNLAVIARMCDRVGVLYAGTLVEQGPAQRGLRRPRHPYTVGLLRCLPHHGAAQAMAGSTPSRAACRRRDRRRRLRLRRALRAAQTLCRTERAALVELSAAGSPAATIMRQAHELPRARRRRAWQPRSPTGAGAPVVSASGLSKTLQPGRARSARGGRRVLSRSGRGETLGLVGESGSGKTTLASVLPGLTAPDERRGDRVRRSAPRRSRSTKRNEAQVRALQIVFQNPDSALNRSHSVRS